MKQRHSGTFKNVFCMFVILIVNILLHVQKENMHLAKHISLNLLLITVAFYFLHLSKSILKKHLDICGSNTSDVRQ